MCNNVLGKKNWIIPDCELPQPGEGVAKGHESVIIVNDSDVDAEINVEIFFTDKDPYTDIKWTVGAKRVKCFRMNNLQDMCGFGRDARMNIPGDDSGKWKYRELIPDVGCETITGFWDKSFFAFSVLTNTAERVISR